MGLIFCELPAEAYQYLATRADYLLYDCLIRRVWVRAEPRARLRVGIGLRVGITLWLRPRLGVGIEVRVGLWLGVGVRDIG